MTIMMIPWRRATKDKYILLLILLKKLWRSSKPMTGARNMPLLLIATDKDIKAIDWIVDCLSRRYLTALKVNRQNKDSVYTTLKNMPAGLYRKSSKPVFTIFSELFSLTLLIFSTWLSLLEHYLDRFLRITFRSAAAIKKATLLRRSKNKMANESPIYFFASCRRLT